MNLRYYFCTFFLIVATALPAFGQSSGENRDSDPFKNDPFFSKPLDELLHQKKADSVDNKESETPDDSSYKEDRDVQHYVSRINVEGLDYGGAFEAGPYSSNRLYGLYPSLPMIHFNRVNGLFLGVRKERMQWYNNDWLGIASVHPHGMIGYSFGQSEFQYEAGLERYIGFKDRILIGAEYHSSTTTNDYWRVGLTETSFTSFFAGYDYLDYYKQTGFGAYLLFRTNRFFEGGVSYNNDRFNSLDPGTDYALFGSHGRYRPNPPVDFVNGSPVDTLNISSLSFSASLNPKRLIIAPRFTFSLFGDVEIADPGLASSDYSYTKYTTELISYLNFEPGGVLKYRLMAGSITGEAPLFKEFRLGGPGSLRAMPYKLLPGNNLGGNKMILSNSELQFGSTDFGSWGGDWIDFDDIYISLFLDSGWVTDYRGTNSVALDGFSEFDFSDLEHNGGFGLGTNSIRAELAWDLNHTSRTPMFWIRLNPTF